MSTTKIVYGLYADDDDLMNGVKAFNDKGIKINEVYTPFPVHGLDKALGLKKTRISDAAFIYACYGVTIGATLTWYVMNHDWPQNIGGKPAFAVPNFIPATFEWTVLFTAFGMTITFFFATHLFPGRAPRVMELRATDDRFVIAIDAKGNIPHEDITNILKEAGAVEIKHNDRKYVSYE